MKINFVNDDFVYDTVSNTSNVTVFYLMLTSCCCRSKSGKLKTSYKRENVSLDADADLQMSGPVVRGSSVLM